MKVFTRNCPQCNKEIKHKSEKNRDFSKEHGKKCQSCCRKGKNNPMCGKSVYDSWVSKYGKEIAEKMKTDWKSSIANSWDEEKIKQHKTKISDSLKGENNPMYGKNLYDIWEANYGKEVADIKQAELNKKRSVNSKGENNSMYGKPAPIGSGNGWKGWYKGVYFASLREFYFLKYLFDNNINFENGEKRKYKVSYEFMGKISNYFLDFYLPETDTYIEIKPKKLVNSPRNSAKFKAAIEKLGDKFKVLTEEDLNVINVDTMYLLYINKDLIFMGKYEQKFLDYYNNIERRKKND